jgi:hypothetical protein
MYPLLIANAVSGPQHNQFLYLAKQVISDSIPMHKDEKLLNCDGAATQQNLKVNSWIIGTIFLLSMLARLDIPKQF